VSDPKRFDTDGHVGVEGYVVGMLCAWSRKIVD